MTANVLNHFSNISPDAGKTEEPSTMSKTKPFKLEYS